MKSPKNLHSEMLPLFPLILPTVAFRETDTLPKASGIYFALNEASCVLYVGATKNLWQRWRNHHKYEHLTQHACTHIAYYLCPIVDLHHVERAMILQFHPCLNSHIETSFYRIHDQSTDTLRPTNKCSTSFRLSDEARAMLRTLARDMGIGQGDVLELLIRKETEHPQILLPPVPLDCPRPAH